MADLFGEIVVIGAGPAGLSAALAAAQSGKSVLLLDDNPHPGGQIWRTGPAVVLPALARHYRQAVAAQKNIRWLHGCKVVALCGPRRLLYEDAQHCGVIEFRHLILCCGARELLLPFPGWTLPGVTGAGGLQAQIKQGLDVRGRRVAIAGSGPLLLAVADTVRRAGGEVVLLAEQAPLRRTARFACGLWRWPGKLRQSVRLFNPRYRGDSYVLAAHGGRRLDSIEVQERGRVRRLACDWLACGYGLVPNIELAQSLGCRIARQAVAVNARQQSSVAHIYAAGECTGVGGSELALAEGAIAGYAASGAAPPARTLRARERWQRFAAAVAETFGLDPALKTLATAQTLLCRCEDVTLEQVAGQADWRSAKLASRCGMGACQGKICATAARYLFDWPLAPPRTPLTPVRTATLLRGTERESDA
ncbi:FAD/NAD(P)-binding oxidoreductase [Serratia rubidaea]|uniref:NAD(P)/FAD-dependent oxidoreductase n=1 Tax=Serratia rubidaea TaxID=61652 RepID=A0A448SW22_SERRU|nr:FAD/NAD(P)-binding oxidoreductase [Serratia rubidaea]MBH1928700.1 NAD(P)/FAD-dependent oxidoreductase [Serratia rubidaea]MDC6119617.1 FAD/NAD(P)-binding oxidoreductase [Serratia rubidaea]MEB7584495.1 NAD(P)/FAD-dependent oxidoreductase [Serratia rubidaea]VEI71803.1 Rhodocoxin reductase [Serratia rubidaea]